nr:MAG TPA_asm: hypothetical protein [Caudoviricetes sp.]
MHLLFSRATTHVSNSPFLFRYSEFERMTVILELCYYRAQKNTLIKTAAIYGLNSLQTTG